MKGVDFPAVRYRQGGREMVVTAIEPHALLQIVQLETDSWKPLGDQPHGNRPKDPAHQARIADYLEREEAWVLGAVVLYVSPTDAEFTPAEGWEDEPIAQGVLTVRFGARVDIGDGQHRLGGLKNVADAHDDADDPIDLRLRMSGQPAVIVIDDNHLHRAQDFTDLQQNVKPPAASLALSMDRRQAINRFVVELVQREELPVFDGGNRVEFLKDSPSKLSPRLFSFKTVRYATGTALIGVSQHQAAAWQRTANQFVEDNRQKAMADAVQMWGGLAELPGLVDVISGDLAPARFRERSLLASAGVQYAIGYAIHLGTEQGVPTQEATSALAKVSFERPRSQPDSPKPSETNPIAPNESIFAGNLVDPATGKLASGRPAWEAAGQALHRAILANV